MPKGNILDDTFEQLVELGQSTAKKTGQAMKQTFGPKALWNSAFGKSDDKTQSSEKQGGPALRSFSEGGRTSEVERAKRSEKSTPLDFQNLQKKFETKDKVKADRLKNRLFQLVKSGEEKVWEEKKQEKIQKERQEVLEGQEKKRKEIEKRKVDEQTGIPKGKERRSIFSRKKVVQRERAEFKPASGKQ